MFNNSCIIHPILSERGVYTVSIWNPSFHNSSTSEISRLNVAVTDAYNETEGDNGYVYNQATSLSRWISVGDFLLNAGRQNIYLKALNQKSVFNAIRFSMHPPLTIIESKSSTLIPYNTFIYLLFLVFKTISILP
jgi:hypothetical protein